MADGGARREGSSFLERQLFGAPDAPATDNHGTVGGRPGDVVGQRPVLGSERQPCPDRGDELFPIGTFELVAMAGVDRALLATTLCGLRGRGAGFLDGLRRGEQPEPAAVGTVLAAGTPGVPIDTSGLDRSGHKRFTGWEELPALWQLKLAVLGVPESLLRVVDVEM